MLVKKLFNIQAISVPYLKLFSKYAVNKPASVTIRNLHSY